MFFSCDGLQRESGMQIGRQTDIHYIHRCGLEHSLERSENRRFNPKLGEMTPNLGRVLIHSRHERGVTQLLVDLGMHGSHEPQSDDGDFLHKV